VFLPICLHEKTKYLHSKGEREENFVAELDFSSQNNKMHSTEIRRRLQFFLLYTLNTYLASFEFPWARYFALTQPQYIHS